MTERIIARPCAWRNGSPSAALRWDAIREADQTVLATGTERPLEDGAFALLGLGLFADIDVTMRHEGVDYDSFKPFGLWMAARGAQKRARVAAAFADFRGDVSRGTAKSGSGGTSPYLGGDGASTASFAEPRQ